jgi:hypothetical protein
MTYTEKVHTGWGSRILDSIKGILVGCILVILAFPLIFWNEGKAVKRAKALNEGAGMVVSVNPDQIDPANNGRLVHLTAFASTDAILTDNQLGVSLKGLRLDRYVEMYQWHEHKSETEEKNLGGSTDTTTTYTYELDWSDKLIRSSEFKVPTGHKNPQTMPYQSNRWLADKASFGAFELTSYHIAHLHDGAPLTVTPEMLDEKLQTQFQYMGDLLYHGKDPDNPKTGDMRIRYNLLEPQEISLVGRQINNSFEAYVTTNGEEILFITNGVHSAEALFAKAHEANVFRTWLLRGVSFFMMFVGLSLLFKPLSVLADVVPFIGNVVAMGTTLVAFLLSLTLTFITIAIAWLVFRPLLGLALLLMAGGSIYLLRRRRSQIKAPESGAVAQAE